jgi:hypothetical protein
VASSQPPPGRPKPWNQGSVAVYHITHVGNLPGLAEDGWIYCDEGCTATGRQPVSIAYSDLKAKRTLSPVTVAAGGTLAHYVPFYYAPRSPMLYVNWRGYVGTGGQDDIVHLVCDMGDLTAPNKFVITDGHPVSPLSCQYDTQAALSEIDWNMMRTSYWSDTDSDGDRKRRRQAEFLVHRQVSMSSVRLVGVLDEQVASQAEQALSALDDPPPVCVRPDWYY